MVAWVRAAGRSREGGGLGREDAERGGEVGGGDGGEGEEGERAVEEGAERVGVFAGVGGGVGGAGEAVGVCFLILFCFVELGWG